MKPYRNSKLASLVQETLNTILLKEFNFDGAIVTVLNVVVSKDNLKATVQLGIIPNQKELEVFKLLREREREIRHKLLRKTRLRYVPKLLFEIVQNEDTLEKNKVE
tara:strand:+ start:4886 stop:5203 length:318 start_codon:yes stop_codon:yes gene_type:complete